MATLVLSLYRTLLKKARVCNQVPKNLRPMVIQHFQHVLTSQGVEAGDVFMPASSSIDRKHPGTPDCRELVRFLFRRNMYANAKAKAGAGVNAETSSNQAVAHLDDALAAVKAMSSDSFDLRLLKKSAMFQQKWKSMLKQRQPEAPVEQFVVLLEWFVSESNDLAQAEAKVTSQIRGIIERVKTIHTSRSGFSPSAAIPSPSPSPSTSPSPEATATSQDISAAVAITAPSSIRQGQGLAEILAGSAQGNLPLEEYLTFPSLARDVHQVIFQELKWATPISYDSWESLRKACQPSTLFQSGCGVPELICMLYLAVTRAVGLDMKLCFVPPFLLCKYEPPLTFASASPDPPSPEPRQAPALEPLSPSSNVFFSDEETDVEISIPSRTSAPNSPSFETQFSTASQHSSPIPPPPSVVENKSRDWYWINTVNGNVISRRMFQQTGQAGYLSPELLSNLPNRSVWIYMMHIMLYLAEKQGNRMEEVFWTEMIRLAVNTPENAPTLAPSRPPPQLATL